MRVRGGGSVIGRGMGANGSPIVIQFGGICITFCQEEGILLQSITIEVGGVLQYFSKCWGQPSKPPTEPRPCVWECIPSETKLFHITILANIITKYFPERFMFEIFL